MQIEEDKLTKEVELKEYEVMNEVDVLGIPNLCQKEEM